MSEQANLTDDETELDVPFEDDNDFDAGDEVAAPVAFDAGDTNRSNVTGPSSYAPHERMGRSRRIGSDVRMRDINYKNIPLLSRFLDARGRILSRRKTRVSAKVQRYIVKSIKHARHLALLPYTADQTRIVRKRR